VGATPALLVAEGRRLAERVSAVAGIAPYTAEITLAEGVRGHILPMLPAAARLLPAAETERLLEAVRDLPASSL
jgi:hypothetical protein